MEVTVRVDNSHSEHGWNWVDGHFLSMDKGTTRELIGAHLFRVEFLSPQGPQICGVLTRWPRFGPGIRKRVGSPSKKP